MENLNFCRHMALHLTRVMAIPNTDENVRSRANHLIDLACASQKFTLPPGGILLEDDELRAIDNVELMKLPHHFVALEYQFLKARGKVITFARQRGDLDAIAITPVIFTEANGCWTELPTFFIPADSTLAVNTRVGGRANINVLLPDSCSDEVGRQGCIAHASIVLAFLNALQCSNVHVTKSKKQASKKKIKSAYSFDEYHVLTIDVPGRAGEGEAGNLRGDHRAPREHLRRGHIRRLSDSRRIWVNATVVSAGRGAGVVTKDYLLRTASKMFTRAAPDTSAQPGPQP